VLAITGCSITLIGIREPTADDDHLVSVDYVGRTTPVSDLCGSVIARPSLYPRKGRQRKDIYIVEGTDIPLVNGIPSIDIDIVG
jgi:hypothetical protein